MCLYVYLSLHILALEAENNNKKTRGKHRRGGGKWTSKNSEWQWDLIKGENYTGTEERVMLNFLISSYYGGEQERTAKCLLSLESCSGAEAKG